MPDYKLSLPDSEIEVRLRGVPQEREDEILELQDLVAKGEGDFRALRKAVIEACYARVDLTRATTADLAHLTRTTLQYSIGGPAAVKNLLGSGAGTAAQS
jgi:hypothetical protein